MGQFPVPAVRVIRTLTALAGLTAVATSAVSLSPVVRADYSVTQDSAGPKVDLDILNANLLSVVRALRLQSGAQIVVEGGDKAYNSVSLTVSGSLPSVLNYVAMSAGATVTKNSDGVYVLRPAGASQTDTSSPAGMTDPAPAPVAAAAQAPRGPMHWETIHLQYVGLKFVLQKLRDTDDINQMEAEDAVSAEAIKSASNVSVVVPQTPFTVNSENTGDANREIPINPGVPNSQGIQGGNGATQANYNVSNNNSQAQQFVPGFQQGGGFGGQGGQFGGQGGGFGGQGGGFGGGPGGAGANAANLRPDGIKSIIADEPENSLLVQGDAEGIQELRQIIQLLDKPAKQVQIKAEFITASVATIDQFGINFQLVPAPNISTAFTGSTVQGSTVVEFSQGNLVAELQAQLSTDQSKVVSAPLVTTTNNMPGVIQFQEQIPYVTSTTNVSGSGTATSSTGVGFLTVSSGLTVTPRVNGDNSVTMTLNLPNTTTNPSADTSLPPTTTTQQISTTRTVANGETMVLGGLVSKNDSNARVSVPFLGNLPIIGSLFRTRNVNDANTELLIFITPTVLPYPGQFETPTPAIDSGVGVTP